MPFGKVLYSEVKMNIIMDDDNPIVLRARLDKLQKKYNKLLTEQKISRHFVRRLLGATNVITQANRLAPGISAADFFLLNTTFPEP